MSKALGAELALMALPGTICAAQKGCLRDRMNLRQQQASSTFLLSQSQDSIARDARSQQRYSASTEAFQSDERYGSALQWLMSGGKKEDYFDKKREYEEQQRQAALIEQEREQQERVEDPGAGPVMDQNTMILMALMLLAVIM